MRNIRRSLALPSPSQETAMPIHNFLRSVAPPIAAAAALATALLYGAFPARAADIQLFSAAAMQSVFKEIRGDFERTSGHKLVIRYATMGAITQRVLGGETADVVIGSTPSIATLVKAGRIRPDSVAMICKVGVGMVGPSGTAKPRGASAEALKRALIAAK